MCVCLVEFEFIAAKKKIIRRCFSYDLKPGDPVGLTSLPDSYKGDRLSGSAIENDRRTHPYCVCNRRSYMWSVTCVHTNIQCVYMCEI